MKGVLFYGPKDIRLVDAPVPEPGPGEVLLKVRAALTCGTDFKAYRQGHKVLLPTVPAPFGHEVAGVVAKTGKGVKNFKAGDRVVAANSAPCDGCFYCKRGQNQLCENLKLHNGAYAEYDLIPASIVKHNLWKLPKGLDFKTAALSEPLACAVHAVEIVAPLKGETVAVIGAGAMSLLLIQALKARGARVIVIGRGRPNLELAHQAGADDVMGESRDPVETVRDVTGGRGADCVFEAVGKPETWAASLAMVRKGGKVCLFGGCAPGTLVPIDAHRVHYHQLSLFGVFHHTPKYFKKALDLLAAGKVKTDLLVAGSIPLSEVPAYFAANFGHSNRKVAVLP